MTYNEQETTCNDLQRVRNDLKQPTTSKIGLEATYNMHEAMYNNLKLSKSKISKKQPTTSRI